MRFDDRIKWLLFALILFVFAKCWEPGVGLDSATYGSVAKDILATGNWLRPKLAAHIFDPFVEHPYLGLWLDAISIKIWGATTLGITFTASVLGILGVLSFFAAIRRLIDEHSAMLAVILLLTINVFMNFMSSGWLDMPMLAFILFGFYFCSRISKDESLWVIFLVGFTQSCAVLTKGAAAVGIIPILLFAANQFKWKLKPLAILSAGFFIPLGAFTWIHYQSQGFIFWKEYYFRQFVLHNDSEAALFDPVGGVWYIRDAIIHAHVVAILFIPGVILLWRNKHRWLAITALLQFIIHLAVYAFSNRHNRQYLLPIFPWFALTAGYLISLIWKINTERWSKGIFYLAVTYFVTVSILPITVHRMTKPEIYVFASKIKDSPIKSIYFEANSVDRICGEMTSPFITWYLRKTPLMFNATELPEIIANLKNSEAVLLERGESNDKYLKNHDLICAWNELWILISTEGNCSSLDHKKIRNLEEQEL